MQALSSRKAPKVLRKRRWQTLVHRGEHGVSRKPLRREGRLSPPVPVVHALAQISFARGPRVQRPPGLPCALFIERVRRKQNSGATRRENADLYPLRSLKIESGLRRDDR